MTVVKLTTNRNVFKYIRDSILQFAGYWILTEVRLNHFVIAIFVQRFNVKWHELSNKKMYWQLIAYKLQRMITSFTPRCELLHDKFAASCWRTFFFQWFFFWISIVILEILMFLVLQSPQESWIVMLFLLSSRLILCITVLTQHLCQFYSHLWATTRLVNVEAILFQFRRNRILMI